MSLLNERIARNVVEQRLNDNGATISGVDYDSAEDFYSVYVIRDGRKVETYNVWLDVSTVKTCLRPAYLSDN